MASARRKLPISLFLQNFRVMDEKLQERKSCIEASIDVLCAKPLGSLDEMNKLNVAIAEKRAVQMVYDLVNELKEELEEGLEPVAPVS